MKSTRKICFITTFLIFLFLVPRFSFSLSDKIYKELDVFTRIIDILDKQYVDNIDEHELIQGAINGMLTSLDPHTVYLPADLYKDFQSDTTGKFGGIGIEITLKEGILTVVTPLQDSPAFIAGVKSGDRIIKIDGELTKGMSLMDAVHKMRGPKGKKVTITVWREGFTETKNFTMTREIIRMQSVKYELQDGGYGYVQVASFQEHTADSLRKTLKGMEEESGAGLKGIILDLRDNPGGLLTEAVKLADIFMSRGLIVITRGRDKDVETKKAKKNSPYEKLPVVVLVNQGSASAAEIVAGALQDSRRAKILGLPSFGKGSVQTLMELGNNEAVKITIARYYTPNGKSIEGKGIKPDIALGMPQLDKDFPKKEGGERPDLRDYQKQKALQYLKTRN